MLAYECRGSVRVAQGQVDPSRSAPQSSFPDTPVATNAARDLLPQIGAACGCRSERRPGRPAGARAGRRTRTCCGCDPGLAAPELSRAGHAAIVRAGEIVAGAGFRRGDQWRRAEPSLVLGRRADLIALDECPVPGFTLRRSRDRGRGSSGRAASMSRTFIPVEQIGTRSTIAGASLLNAEWSVDLRSPAHHRVEPGPAATDQAAPSIQARRGRLPASSPSHAHRTAGHRDA